MRGSLWVKFSLPVKSDIFRLRAMSKLLTYHKVRCQNDMNFHTQYEVHLNPKKRKPHLINDRKQPGVEMSKTYPMNKTLTIKPPLFNKQCKSV